MKYKIKNVFYEKNNLYFFLIVLIICLCLFFTACDDRFIWNQKIETNNDNSGDSSSNNSSSQNDKEEKYYETMIGDYIVNESESNNTISSAQTISVNGTTIRGSVNRSSDIDMYKVRIPAGKKLDVLLLPEYDIDNAGMLLGLCDADKNAIAVGYPDTIADKDLTILVYNNNNNYTLTMYVVVLYNPDYTYKNTVAEYALFFYWK